MMIFQRGFFCDDESLRYPYRSSTVSNGVLFFEIILVPLTVIVFVEWCWLRSQHSGVKSAKICGRNVHPLFGAVRKNYGTYSLGLLCSLLINMLIKISVGRLRPHFVEVCRPDWNQIECHTSDGRPKYVDPIPCTGDANFRFFNSILSFPSGHASLSTFVMVYLTIYLQARLCIRYSFVFRVILQILMLTIALYTGISRIHDYKHHWEDVLAGFVEGTLEAFFWTHYVTDLVVNKKRRLEISQDHETEIAPDTKENLLEKIYEE